MLLINTNGITQKELRSFLEELSKTVDLKNTRIQIKSDDKFRLVEFEVIEL